MKQKKITLVALCGSRCVDCPAYKVKDEERAEKIYGKG